MFVDASGDEPYVELTSPAYGNGAGFDRVIISELEAVVFDAADKFFLSKQYADDPNVPAFVEVISDYLHANFPENPALLDSQLVEWRSAQDAERKYGNIQFRSISPLCGRICFFGLISKRTSHFLPSI